MLKFQYLIAESIVPVFEALTHYQAKMHFNGQNSVWFEYHFG